MYLIGNKKLTSLTGLQNLTKIDGDFKVSNCSSLLDFNELSKLRTINGSIIIHDNSHLISLSGLDSISPESIKSLEIYSNYILKTCAIESICSYLAKPFPILYFYENALECTYMPILKESCRTLNVDDEVKENDFSLFPNPVCDQAVVSFILIEKSRVIIEVLNQLGMVVLNVVDKECNSGNNHLNLYSDRKLPSGLYYCRIKAENR